MTKKQIDQRLSQMGKDRYWLAAEAGYTYDTLRNCLAPNAKDLSFAMEAKISRVFLKHAPEEVAEVGGAEVGGAGADIWDTVYFSGNETISIERARNYGGYSALKDYYREAVISFTDNILTAEKYPKVAELEAKYDGGEGIIDPIKDADVEANSEGGEDSIRQA